LKNNKTGLWRGEKIGLFSGQKGEEETMRNGRTGATQLKKNWFG